MTWLPGVAGTPERDAVFGLEPEVDADWRRVLDCTWQIVDTDLLETCRLRSAQTHDCRAALAGADPDRLAELESWRSSEAISGLLRAALDYAEQFFVDHNGISEQQLAALLQHLSTRQLRNFVFALYTHDATVRAMKLLDVEPHGDAGDARPAPPLATRGGSEPPIDEAPFDPEYAKALHDYGNRAVMRDGVDVVTSEVCRLRNANHQRCRY